MLPPIASAAKAAADAFHAAGLPPLWVKSYGCVACQKHHYEGNALYNEHLYRQSKHGVKTVLLWYAVWDRYLARERKEHASK